MSNNLHSKRGFEKMDAVQIGEEKSLFVSLVGTVEEKAKKPAILHFIDFYVYAK